MLIVAAIREGIPYALFRLIKRMTPFSDADWAKLLGISAKSLQRYKQDKQSFKSLHFQRIIKLAEVTKLGLEVFGEIDKFRQWLDTPNYALGKLKPFELLKDSYGKELLMIELTHINHGILA